MGVSVHIATDLAGFSVSDSFHVHPDGDGQPGRWFLQVWIHLWTVRSGVEFQCIRRIAKPRIRRSFGLLPPFRPLKMMTITADIGDTLPQTSASFLGKISLVIGNAA